MVCVRERTQEREGSLVTTASCTDRHAPARWRTCHAPAERLPAPVRGGVAEGRGGVNCAPACVGYPRAYPTPEVIAYPTPAPPLKREGSLVTAVPRSVRLLPHY